MSDADYVTFEAAIEPMVWGKSTYTVLRLPADILAQLPGAKRVEGEFADFPVNLAIARAPVLDDAFLWAGKSLLDQTGLTPGERFEVRLRAADLAEVETPTDLSSALRSAGKTEAWEKLSPGKKRSLLHGVASAKRAQTRSDRIAKLVASLE